MLKPDSEFILTVVCPDTIGIVAAVTGFLAERRCNILESAQYNDCQTGLFFLRIRFAAGATGCAKNELEQAFAVIGERFRMDWHLYDPSVKTRVLIMVSKAGHCLNDLLYRYRVGALQMDIPAVVSNHRDFYRQAAADDIPFHYLPVTKDNKPQQEAKLMNIIEEERIDLVVLARYMQVLSDELCARLAGRIINIHHSFLPSFRGAKPYHQAHTRGVKLIGATAHYVTAELDEGPIIAQDVEHVDHAMTAEDFIAVGRDVESLVLARAVKSHIERRVLINGNKTVVFR